MKTVETVLLYNFENKEALRKIKAILIQMGIRVKTANHQDLSESVGYLIGMKEIPSTGESYEGEPMERELLVMNGFTNNRLNAFLAQMKKRGVPQIPYKAMITATNQSWPLKQLYIEIEKEHKEMNGL